MSSMNSCRSSRSSSSEPDPMIVVAARLKELARESHAARIPYPEDQTEHYSLFSRAVLNVLSTDLALFTFAQIVDGLPTLDVAWDRRIPDISLVNAYRSTVRGSRAFQVRLIELVAVTMHQLGALFFKLDVCMHRGGRPDIDTVTQFEEPPLMPGWVEYHPPITLFDHHGYVAYGIYPEGVADMVGYWAEDRIPCGVAVFHRPAEARAPQQPPNVYFNSARRGVTFRYTQLLDEQQQAMADFFLSETPREESCPLPVLTDMRNRVRVEFDKAIMHHVIHRDAWECMPPSEEALRLHNKSPQNEFDYPEHRALLEAVNRQLGIPPPARHGGEHSSSAIQSSGAQESGSRDKSRGSTSGDRRSQGAGD